MQIEDKKEGLVYCRRCGRLLKDEESKRLGFGKRCYKEYLMEVEGQFSLFNSSKSGGDVNATK